MQILGSKYTGQATPESVATYLRFVGRIAAVATFFSFVMAVGFAFAADPIYRLWTTDDKIVALRARACLGLVIIMV